MKHFIKILVLLLLSVNSFGQVVQRGRLPNTQKDDALIIGQNFFPPRYVDTVAASLVKGVDTCGALIFLYSTNTYWYRRCNPKVWTQITTNSTSTTSVSIKNDTTLTICNGAGSCSDFHINNTILNITNAYFVNDTLIKFCNDSLGRCDSVVVPRQTLNIYQNFVTSPATGIVEFGGGLLHNTTANTNYYQLDLRGHPLSNYPIAITNDQTFQTGTGIASYTHRGSAGASLIKNNVRIGFNYQGLKYSPVNNTIPSYFRNYEGFWLGINATGYSDLGLKVDDSSSKVNGIFFHTQDTLNAEAITFYGLDAPKRGIIAPIDSNKTMDSSRLMTILNNGKIQLYKYGYPTHSVEDTTSLALYPDANGVIKLGRSPLPDGNNFDVSVVNQHDSLIINRSGLASISTPLVHYHYMGDSTGSNKINFFQSGGVLLRGRGINIDFDTTNKMITLTNVGGGSTTNTNNYVNSLAYTSNDSTLTVGRVGLGNLTTTIPTSSTWYVGDSAGVQQFGVPKFQNLNLKAGTGISLSFDGVNKLVTISNTGGGGGGGSNNYTTNVAFSGGTLTTSRNLLPDLTTTGIGTVQRVGFSAPSTINVSGSPITGTGTITISGAGSSSQYYDGTFGLRPFPTVVSTFTNDAGYVNSIAHVHGIANSSGTQQFTYGIGDNVRYTAGTGMSIAFNSGTKEITFTNTGGGTGANNFTTNVLFDNTTGILSTVRNGLSTLTTSNLGTVQYVKLSMPSAFTVTGSPIVGQGGLFTVTGAGSTSQLIRGDGSLAPINTLLSQLTNDVGFITTSSFNVANSAGTTQFGVGTGNSFRFTEGAGINLTFNAGTKELVITNVGTATSSANNYPTSLVYDSTSQILSLTRNGLSTLTTRVPSGGVSAATISQTIINVLNTSYFPNQTAGWQIVMGASNWTTRNAEMMSSGIGSVQRLDFVKTADTASLKVNEYRSGSTLYDISLSNHPDLAGNIIRVNMPDVQGINSSWTPEYYSQINKRTTASRTDMYSRLFFPSATGFFSVDTGAVGKGIPSNSITQNIVRESGVGTGNFNIDATLFNDSVSRMYWVQAQIDSVLTPAATDFVFVIDTTLSMGDAIANIQTNILQIANLIVAKSNNDYRLGLIAFGDQAPDIKVRFSSNNIAAFTAAVNTLKAAGGSGVAESSNVAMDSAINDFSYRGGVAKLILLVTDAPPSSGCGYGYDFYQQCDVDYVRSLSHTANGLSIKVSSVFTNKDASGGLGVTTYSPTSNLLAKDAAKIYPDSTHGLFAWDTTNGTHVYDAIHQIIDTFITSTTFGNVVTVFNWGYGNGLNRVTVGTAVTATGSFQTLEKGLKVKLTSPIKSGDLWTFRVYPPALPAVDTSNYEILAINEGGTFTGEATRLNRNMMSVQNSSGTPQFTVKYGQNLRLTAGANISIGFDNTTNNVTITGSAAGITTIGTIDTSPSSNGLTISGSTLYTQYATGSLPGMLSASGTQTIGGNKIINGYVGSSNFYVINGSTGNVAVMSFTGNANQNISVPNNSGVLALDVNNVFANSTGHISLTTDNITQGSTNLYFTNALARSAISLTTIGSGAATYNSTTGVLNVPTPTSTGTVTNVSSSYSNGTALSVSVTNPTTTPAITHAWQGTSSQKVLGNGTLATNTDGTVTSVGITSSAAVLTITNTPITTSGNIGVNFNGSSSQLVAGNGSLVAQGNFIFNQTSQQSSSNFNISGNGTIAGNVIIGNHTSTPTTSPNAIDMGATYSSSAGVNPKLQVYNNTTVNIGIGASANQMDYITAGGINHVFYIDGIEQLRISSTKVNASSLSGTGTRMVVSNAAGDLSTQAIPTGTGTVVSVAMTVPTGLSVSGSPITTSGTLAVTTSLSGVVIGTGSGFSTATIGSLLTYSGSTLNAVNQKFGHPSGDNTAAENRTFDLGSLYTFNFTASGGNQALNVTAVNGVAVTGVSTNNNAAEFYSTNGRGLYVSSTNFIPAFIHSGSATSNAIQTILQLDAHPTAGANGLGASLDYSLSSSSGSTITSNQIVSVWTNASSKTSNLDFYGINSGTIARKMSLAGSGQLTLDAYGSGSFTGSVARGLGVTSSGNVIEYTPNNGTVSSVGLTMPSGFTVSSSPVTTSGTLAVTTSLNGVLVGNGSGFTTATIGGLLSYSGTTLNAVNQKFGQTTGYNTATEDEVFNLTTGFNMFLTNGTTNLFSLAGSNGQLALGGYSGTNLTGNPTYILGTDASGNVVKTAGFVNVVVITSDGTYTPSFGTNRIVVEMVGGGGGGGGAAQGSGAACGSGGGSGGYAKIYISTVVSSYAVSVGNGGTGGTGNGLGANGSASTFNNNGTLVTANGGYGGGWMSNSTTVNAGAGGNGADISTNGTVNAGGNQGSIGIRWSSTAALGGSGGGSPLGGGGNGMGSNGNGGDGTGYGAGGAGATMAGSGADKTGGGGTRGVIIIYEYK